MRQIPLIDLTDKTPVDLCRMEKERGLALLEATKNSYGILSRIAAFLLFPVGDRLAKKLLNRTNNPYSAEIDEMAKLLGVKGVHALNLSYEWGCTSGVMKNTNGAQLVRVLDWPFPGLGENTVVAKQNGSAGYFYNITWPGVSGIFQAMAPNRFAVALNQAPLRKSGFGLITDWVKGRFFMYKQNALPPAHLLRYAFENAKDYTEAKKMLAEAPISIPVIYIISGVKEGEGCVIERTENAAFIHELGANDWVTTANHFSEHIESNAKGWTPRGEDSCERAEFLRNVTPQAIAADNFNWMLAPVANDLTRLVLVTDANNVKLKLMGTFAEKPVTEIFKI